MWNMVGKMQRLSDLTGLEFTSQYVWWKWRNLCSKTKTNADILIGANNFKKLFQKIQSMSLIDDSKNSFRFNVLWKLQRITSLVLRELMIVFVIKNSNGKIWSSLSLKSNVCWSITSLSSFFGVVRLFWRLLYKSLFEDFVSYNFLNRMDWLVLLLVFLTIGLFESYLMSIARYIEWKYCFLYFWNVICRLHEWKQYEELKVSWNDEVIRLAVISDDWR